ncbi:hypothetical protein IJM86_02595 [bacterium]|nr:hypothetical protein [bacterium]
MSQEKFKSFNTGYVNLKLCFCFQATIQDYILYALADQFEIHCDAAYLSQEIRLPLEHQQLIDHSHLYFQQSL